MSFWIRIASNCRRVGYASPKWFKFCTAAPHSPCVTWLLSITPPQASRGDYQSTTLTPRGRHQDSTWWPDHAHHHQPTRETGRHPGGPYPYGGLPQLTQIDCGAVDRPRTPHAHLATRVCEIPPRTNLSGRLIGARIEGDGSGQLPFLGLSVTGLRISEALALRSADIDWQAGLLRIRKTKFGKARLVPLHPSACRGLLRYAWQRDAYLGFLPTAHFFCRTVVDH